MKDQGEAMKLGLVRRLRLADDLLARCRANYERAQC